MPTPVAVSCFASMAVIAMIAGGCTSGQKSDGNAKALSTGPISFAATDPGGVLKTLVGKWNETHNDQHVTITKLPTDAAGRRNQLVENLQNHSPGYDVIATDVSSTAEFSSQHWLAALKDKLVVDTAGTVKAAVTEAMYGGALYTAPFTAESGLLYYRSDLLKSAPTDWDRLSEDCSVARTEGIACFSGQYAQGSDLATNAVETIYQAGGRVLSADGKSAEIDTAAARKGLEFLVDSYTKKVIPAAAITYREQQSIRAFSSGSLLMLRADPEAFAELSAKTSAVADKFKVAALPGPSGPATLPIAGMAASINASAAHQKTARDFIAYLTGPAAQRTLLTDGSMAPALLSIYSDKSLDTRYPYLGVLKQAWATAQPFPISPAYQEISDALADNVYAAMTGTKKVPQATRDLQAVLNGLSLG
jgi:multiple sugar transport system substrate-binding protein